MDHIGPFCTLVTAHSQGLLKENRPQVTILVLTCVSFLDPWWEEYLGLTDGKFYLIFLERK